MIFILGNYKNSFTSITVTFTYSYEKTKAICNQDDNYLTLL